MSNKKSLEMVYCLACLKNGKKERKRVSTPSSGKNFSLKALMALHIYAQW